MQIKVSTCSVDSDIVTIGRDEVFGPIPEACRKTEVNGSYVFEFNFDECGTFYQVIFTLTKNFSFTSSYIIFCFRK